MTEDKIKQKARDWISELKSNCDLKEILPCDFLLEHLTVLDMVLLADDVETLSELIIHHGPDSINVCVCDALTYIQDLSKNECYKTLRVADGVNISNCIKMKREMMTSMMAPLLEKTKKDSK